MIRPRRRAAITGLGAISGFGRGVDLLWRGLLDGRRAARPVATSEFEGLVAFAPGPWSREEPLSPGRRAVAMALCAVDEAVSDAGGLTGRRVGVSVGTTLGEIGPWLLALRGREPWPEVGRWTWAAPAEAIAAHLDARGPVSTSSMACASGNAALGAALDCIRRGEAEQVVAGGVDAIHDFVAVGFACLKALDPQPSRPFDAARRGLNLGEGACFLVIEDEEHARARGARIRAFLDGYGSSGDATHMTGPDREGRGAARAMRWALEDAGATAEEVGFVSAHGTGTRFNDLMESKAIAAALGSAGRTVAVNSIKGAIGHTLGAAGAIEAALCVRTVEQGTIVPTTGCADLDPEIELDVVRDAPRQAAVHTALSTTSGFGGSNAALVIRRS